ncbi:MAG: GTPase HflX [Fibrobacteraceae bacterium]|jgi:GTP-binding protein HflX|nr:GTPase HflX [Fibrobacteraceae bacterium]MBQ5611100.1 GTPase HflX [Fibrobacteraceae bacterium]MEE1276162.1 GTPase HflX [Fibrobacteraceae bacterium]
MAIDQTKLPERAILVGISTPKLRGRLALEHLEELRRLAETAGAEVVETFMQNLQAFNPSTLIGEGKIEEIRQALENQKVKMLVFDEDLSGSQVRNLENRLPGIKVLDRTGLILDIFAKHAITAESRLMVEIAQLQYIMPRLTRAWTHLCRQHNGGIGTKGPGETQLETDRRLIRNRIRDLKKKLQKIESARDRAAEKRYDIFHVGIVGYTNAGKSTLTNRLTGADVYVENKLFATLDSTTRKLYLGNGNSIILSDTVGFIRKLPHHLVETFRSTLGIAAHADCLLEVVDASALDYKEHLEVTQKVLSSIVDETIPRILVFNKAESASKERREELLANYPDALQISALENIGTEALRLKFIDLWNVWAKKRNLKQQEELKIAEGWTHE